jgi:hypothetical protein
MSILTPPLIPAIFIGDIHSNYFKSYFLILVKNLDGPAVYARRAIADTKQR